MPIVSIETIPEFELACYQFGPERKKIMYVDNEKLTVEMLKWEQEIKLAIAEGRDRPKMPEFVGQCVIQIADGLGKKGNYSGYSWLDEMKEDGIEACCAYLHNYRSDAATRKGKPNPYGYISMIIERAFKHRIEAENRQIYYKNKSLVLMGGLEAFEGEDWGEAAQETNAMMNDMINRAYEYEEKQARKAEEEREKTAKTKPPAPTLIDLFSVGEDA